MAEVIGEFAQASLDQLESALEAAATAQHQWAKRSLGERAEILDSIGRELIARSGEIGEIVSREEGKPLKEGVGEVARSGDFFRYFAQQVYADSGKSFASLRPGVEVAVKREPIGLVAVVTPWNFPVACPSWKIAPALAFGNAVIWKPSNETPASAHALAEVIASKSLPDGLFNLLMGQGGTLGQRLVADRRINGVTFTGSHHVGFIIAKSAVGNLARLQLEMGSKNPLIVMEDANLELAVAAAVSGAFGGTGQRCTATSRLLVHKDVYKKFLPLLVERTKSLRVGHALDPDTDLGPVVSERQLKENLGYIDIAKAEGARLVLGGSRVERRTLGYYMEPAIFADTSPAMRINREEVFGPITCIQVVDGLDEAIESANSTEFGLTAGIFTNSLCHSQQFQKRSRSGCVMVNLPTAGTDYHAPFGGIRSSGYGPRENGSSSPDFYTELKTSYVLAPNN